MKFLPFLLSFIFLILHLSGQTVVRGEVDIQHHHHHKQRITKLFVFGDSYADTGNVNPRGFAPSWKHPYGVTFPGKPAGRFSDGRVITDYIAEYLKVKSPASYRIIKDLTPQHLKSGMNFAISGTGVFETLNHGSNMTTQISFFEKTIEDKVFKTSDIRKSVALVSIAGNDYIRYIVTNESIQGLPSFISSVINQTITNIIRIKELGVRKVMISNLQPFGCLPQETVSSSFKQCNETSNNLFVAYHNTLLTEAVTKLNQQMNDQSSSSFIVLDIYDSFMSVLKHPSTYSIKNELEPCCVGVSSEYFCGMVVKKVKMYKVCENPKSAFFWDLSHPTDAGWRAVYTRLRITNALKQIHDH
ncbi:GDSL esterase/lipase At5g03610-like [Vicia villosa]|uniref:GDSL esterase/lipase At5g03610-like n=1 Tax=Vicia villosa TaxID=3911 RepID=UPI00273AEEE1|nr:GDSL esterase/lipase At5g03610-like [Vicia villosa]